jgi:peroxiredoxin
LSAETDRKLDSYTVFLLVACVALAAIVVALALQNRSLKQQLSHAYSNSGSAPPQFKAGDVVESFTVVSDAGESTTVAFGQGETKTILLVFSSTCPACKDTVPTWRELLASPPAGGVRVVGIQTDRLDANPAAPVELAASFPFPVYGYKRPSHDPLAKVPFIPAAIVVDAKGVVVNAWYGVPGDEAVEALKRELK